MNVSFVIAPARIMEEAEGFFGSIGASIVQREGMSCTASMNHPDLFGREMSLSCRIGDEGGVLKLRRRSGDIVLFELACQLFRSYDMGQGTQPSFYNGQILPNINKQRVPAPMDFLERRLEGGGEKRKSQW